MNNGSIEESQNISNLTDHILAVREGGKVKRCHNLPHHGQYNVAEHCYIVCMKLYYIMIQQNVGPVIFQVQS